MGSPMRDIVADGLAMIIRGLPDEAKIVLNVEDLPREKFESLRCGEEATYLPRSEIWMAIVPLGAGVFLEIETREAPGLRAVS